MTAPGGGIGYYLWRAFTSPWNLLAVFGGAAAAMLTPWPDVLLPLVGAGEAIYLGAPATDVDPASNLDFWMSSGGQHFWNPAQKTPATDWERRIDELMARHIATVDDNERRRTFAEVQRIFAEHQPAVFFAAPHVFVATSARVANLTPSLIPPQILWAADTIQVK